MPPVLRPSARRRARPAVTAVFLVVLATPTAAGATAPPQAERRFEAMTYNLYLGADLGPLFTAPPGPPLVEAAARVYNQMVQTNFPERAEVIAREIAEAAPTVIGLQEVALWQTAPLSDPGALTPTYDFLQILLGELEERGAHYEPVPGATNVNFGGALPISSTTLASFTDHDVILARSDLPTSELNLSNPTSQTFQAKLPLTIGGQQILVPRGWSSVDVKFRGKSYRFVNTHLEAFARAIRVPQAHELIGWMAGSPLPVVLAGDLNTLRGDAADAYALFIAAGFVDGWVEAMPADQHCVEAEPGDPGCTAGQQADLLNFPSELDHVVDYVMHNEDPYVDAVGGSGEIIGEEVADRTLSGLWPSDHAGVNLGLHIAEP
ncbi:MAG TPA: endonuclease/exonuclease/phosphatase family protein [Actinomycetota bacterium]|nr:endonuclease/exonuclease/phosphatase family protein [Actinomycetota bacterium]